MKHLILRKSVMVPARRHASVLKMMTVAAAIACIAAFMGGMRIEQILAQEPPVVLPPPPPEVVAAFRVPLDPEVELVLDPNCSPTHSVTKLIISGRPEIDQPVPFKAPTTVWLCQDPDAVRLVWVRDGATQSSYTTLDEGDSIIYDTDGVEGFCDPYGKYGADPCADLH